MTNMHLSKSVTTIPPSLSLPYPEFSKSDYELVKYPKVAILDVDLSPVQADEYSMDILYSIRKSDYEKQPMVSHRQGLSNTLQEPTDHSWEHSLGFQNFEV